MTEQPSAIRAAVVVALVAWFALGMPNPMKPESAPGPAPTPVSSLDLAPAFASAPDRAKAKHDAHLLGHATNWMADYLEADGARPTPKFASGGQVEDLRVEVCWWVTEGRTFGSQYPDLGPAIGSHLVESVGTESTDLTAEVRARWVKAFRDISVAAIQAAK